MTPSVSILTFVDYTTYFLHIIEGGISLDVAFNDLNQFLEFKKREYRIDLLFEHIQNSRTP